MVRRTTSILLPLAVLLLLMVALERLSTYSLLVVEQAATTMQAAVEQADSSRVPAMSLLVHTPLRLVLREPRTLARFSLVAAEVQAYSMA
jgi:hypothetical protein